MEGTVEAVLSDSQSTLAVFLVKLRDMVPFIPDEEAQELLKVLHDHAKRAMERKSHKTPSKKLEQLSLADLMKHVEKEFTPTKAKKQGATPKRDRDVGAGKGGPPRKSIKSKDVEMEVEIEKGQAPWDYEKHGNVLSVQSITDKPAEIVVVAKFAGKGNFTPVTAVISPELLDSLLDKERTKELSKALKSLHSTLARQDPPITPGWLEIFGATDWGKDLIKK